MKTVLVTGSSGYIAKHIVHQLLAAGFDVRGSVRDPSRGAEVRLAVARALGADPGGRLAFVTLDLDRDDGWVEAMRGVDVLVHTASPFPVVQPRDEAEVVRPAVEGARRALRAALAAGIGRVVMTSSAAAVIYGRKSGDRPVYDETDWTDLSNPLLTPYIRSKTLAERAAWEVAAANPALRLTMVNPGLVLGAPLDDRFGTSLGVVERILAAKDPAMPRASFPIVHVRDIARMHVAAIDNPAAEGRRFLGADAVASFADMARILKAALAGRRIVTREAPDFLIRFIGLFDRSVGTIRPDLGRTYGVSSAAAREVLGIDFMNARQTIVESAQYLLTRGQG
jgi:dihydroflavonol-4-reductase